MCVCVETRSDGLKGRRQEVGTAKAAMFLFLDGDDGSGRHILDYVSKIGSPLPYIRFKMCYFSLHFYPDEQFMYTTTILS